MTTVLKAPYATGRARADIERALIAAGNDIHTLQASELARLEDFHSLGRLATAALVGHWIEVDRVDARQGRFAESHRLQALPG